MHGYQAEIGFDRAGKDLTGSLQEETGRSFLATLDDYERNQFEATYYRLGDWNDLLIRCEGDHIVIEINGYRSVDFHDHEGRRSGFIALQSHGRMKPLIEFRKIEIKELPAQNAATSNAAAGSEGYQLYERRTYTVYPGKMADLDRRFHEHTFRLFEKHGMKVIAYSIRTDKPGTLEYMLAHSNREAADKCWKEFAADPEWKRVVKETEKNGPLVKTVEHSFLTASDYRATESPAGAATPLPDANEKAGRIFLAENQNKARVKTRPSGLQYLILVDGKGKKPAASDVVTVHYKGMLLDGKVFDDATVRPAPPKSLPLSQVIPGWREALQLMKVGSVWRVFVPPNLAYGSRGTDNGAIGPNETLIFEIELVKIEHLR